MTGTTAQSAASLTRARALPRALVVAVLAAALLALSWPRLTASLRYLPVETALEHLRDGAPVDDAQLQELERRGRGALERHDHYRFHDGLSVLSYHRGTDTALPPAERRAALRLAADEALEAVSRAPLKPRLWLRVAAARASLRGDAEGVVPALKMSVLTGRVEPPLLPLRLELMYRYRRDLDAEGLRLLRDQTLLTWRLQPRPVLAGIRSGAIPYHGLASVLAARDPGTLAEIDEALGGLVR